MPTYEVFIDGKLLKVELTKTGEGYFTVKMDEKVLSLELPAKKLDLGKRFSIKMDGKKYEVELPKIEREKLLRVKVEETTFKAEVKTHTKRPTLPSFAPTRVTSLKRTMTSKQYVEGAITAPMTGKILSVRVKKGDKVKAGQVLCVLEAMKMENEITTPKNGTIQEVYVSEDSSVSEGETLFVVS